MEASAIPLVSLRRHDAARVGHKAARLGELSGAGFSVPGGFAIPIEGEHGGGLAEAIGIAVAALGDGPLAVRSSAVEEDLDAASFAGIHLSVLDVRGAEAAVAAAAQCLRARTSDRARAYRAALGLPERQRMAVIVQRLVPADASGVVLSADPVTGARNVAVLTAVPGLGDALVDGRARGEEWRVGAGAPLRVRSNDDDRPVLDAARAAEIAALARRIESHFGAPQDVEWVLADGSLHVVQARPITALPDAVRWDPPVPGPFLRNFRLGEWLAGPVSALFSTWFVPRCEAAFLREQFRVTGYRPRGPQSVVVHGWYFHSPVGTSGGGAVLLAMLRRPVFWRAFVRVARRPELTERAIAAPHLTEYRERLAPRHRELVADAEAHVDAEPSQRILARVDALCDLGGELLWSFAMVGGFAWKAEAALATFVHAHLGEAIGDGHQRLLAGLAAPPCSAAHTAASLDWAHRAGDVPAGPGTGAFDRVADERRAAEVACRDALASAPKLLRRFELLLDLAQRYAVLREEQAIALTRGWPVLRRAVVRLGDALVDRGVLDVPERVFDLEHDELRAALDPASDAIGNLLRRAIERERLRHRQSRLTPPLALGPLPPPLAKTFARALAAMRSRPVEPGERRLVGSPASPGRAQGRVRLVRTLEETGRLRTGEILVTATLTPAWTPVLARASAVVTDGGSALAHASLLVREFGIPAVVAATDATTRLRDGLEIVVDGAAGVVDILG